MYVQAELMKIVKTESDADHESMVRRHIARFMSEAEHLDRGCGHSSTSTSTPQQALAQRAQWLEDRCVCVRMHVLFPSRCRGYACMSVACMRAHAHTHSTCMISDK
jgi:hypothetical protein